MRKLILATAGVMLATTAAMAEFVNPFAYPQPAEGTDFYTVIEIPQGSFTKYEIDADNGHVFVDRYQSMPVVYPANYGSITSSHAGDGDPLDALVYTREPIVPGAMIKVRAIGVLKMIDGGETDDKIVAVPASDIDPTYDDIKSINDLPSIERERLEAFFRVYKQLPEGRKKVELGGFDDVDVANETVQAALNAYRGRNQ
ncbi:inorganic diphosphatase [Mesorhizobium sp. SB112]|uniref:inorganic diphosphatase n=1 Tax=Mesorhizobium sp. SB112 TaxID=3151853 RepID=UPI00326302D5